MKTGREREIRQAWARGRESVPKRWSSCPGSGAQGALSLTVGCPGAQDLYFNLVILLTHDMKWIGREKIKRKI